jgi:hypothetical protein
MTISAYPLQWPAGWRRTQGAYRRDATFSRYKRALSIADGVARVMDELGRMGLGRDDVVISTNVETRMDGFPRSDRSEPGDPGVAVYWQERKGGRKVMAIDHYRRVADNLAAIAATLEAMRAIERHGGAAILERAFTGFTALPAPGAARDWREVLGVPKDASRDDIRAAYRRLASQHHPDKGGSADKMAELNAAQDKALQERAP